MKALHLSAVLGVASICAGLAIESPVSTPSTTAAGPLTASPTCTVTEMEVPDTDGKITKVAIASFCSDLPENLRPSNNTKPLRARTPIIGPPTLYPPIANAYSRLVSGGAANWWAPGGLIYQAGVNQVSTVIRFAVPPAAQTLQCGLRIMPPFSASTTVAPASALADVYITDITPFAAAPWSSYRRGPSVGTLRIQLGALSTWEPGTSMGDFPCAEYAGKGNIAFEVVPRDVAENIVWLDPDPFTPANGAFLAMGI